MCICTSANATHASHVHNKRDSALHTHAYTYTQTHTDTMSNNTRLCLTTHLSCMASLRKRSMCTRIHTHTHTFTQYQVIPGSVWPLTWAAWRPYGHGPWEISEEEVCWARACSNELTQAQLALCIQGTAALVQHAGGILERRTLRFRPNISVCMFVINAMSVQAHCRRVFSFFHVRRNKNKKMHVRRNAKIQDGLWSTKKPGQIQQYCLSLSPRACAKTQENSR
jgi:hypothetical protein